MLSPFSHRAQITDQQREQPPENINTQQHPGVNERTYNNEYIQRKHCEDPKPHGVNKQRGNALLNTPQQQHASGATPPQSLPKSSAKVPPPLKNKSSVPHPTHRVRSCINSHRIAKQRQLKLARSAPQPAVQDEKTCHKSAPDTTVVAVELHPTREAAKLGPREGRDYHPTELGRDGSPSRVNKVDESSGATKIKHQQSPMITRPVNRGKCDTIRAHIVEDVISTPLHITDPASTRVSSMQPEIHPAIPRIRDVSENIKDIGALQQSSGSPKKARALHQPGFARTNGDGFGQRVKISHKGAR